MVSVPSVEMAARSKAVVLPDGAHGEAVGVAEAVLTDKVEDPVVVSGGLGGVPGLQYRVLQAEDQGIGAGVVGDRRCGGCGYRPPGKDWMLGPLPRGPGRRRESLSPTRASKTARGSSCRGHTEGDLGLPVVPGAWELGADGGRHPGWRLRGGGDRGAPA